MKQPRLLEHILWRDVPRQILACCILIAFWNVFAVYLEGFLLMPATTAQMAIKAAPFWRMLEGSALSWLTVVFLGYSGRPQPDTDGQRILPSLRTEKVWYDVGLFLRVGLSFCFSRLTAGQAVFAFFLVIDLTGVVLYVTYQTWRLTNKPWGAKTRPDWRGRIRLFASWLASKDAPWRGEDGGIGGYWRWVFSEEEAWFWRRTFFVVQGNANAIRAFFFPLDALKHVGLFAGAAGLLVQSVLSGYPGRGRPIWATYRADLLLHPIIVTAAVAVNLIVVGKGGVLLLGCALALWPVAVMLEHFGMSGDFRPWHPVYDHFLPDDDDVR